MDRINNRDRAPTGGRMVRQFVRDLRTHILANCAPGDRLGDQEQLARRHGCSASTMVRVLARLSDEGLIERVRGSGTYVSDSMAKAGQTSGLLFFGHAAALFRYEFFREIFLGVVDGTVGTSQQVQLILGHKNNPVAVTTDLLRKLRLERFNSIISMEVFNNDLLSQLAERTVTVSVDFPCHRPGVSSCAIDHEQTIALAVQQLYLLGHKRIGYAADTNEGGTDPAKIARYAAYRRALARHGLPPDPAWLLPLASERGDAAIQAEAWLRMDPRVRPTAVIGVDMVWDLLHAMVALGVRIPEQLSVMGIGQLLRWSPSGETVPPQWDMSMLTTGRPTRLYDPELAPLRSLVLTSILLPFKAMGQWAMTEALRRLANPEAQPGFELFSGMAVPGNTVGVPSA